MTSSPILLFNFHYFAKQCSHKEYVSITNIENTLYTIIIDSYKYPITAPDLLVVARSNHMNAAQSVLLSSGMNLIFINLSSLVRRTFSLIEQRRSNVNSW